MALLCSLINSNHVLCLRLLNVLEVIAPFKHFNKLREFVQMKLPPGFPVKLGEETADSSVRVYV